MELVSLAKEMAQTLAEQAASYRVGQTALRHLDRALWVVEKCARWAVPPPLDSDERPQPELVRPLPWVFFLGLLVALRVTRESISLIYLVLGKPPLRSADVVMYIQSKRRYLRTLKYQGNRNIRARTSAPQETWLGALRSLFEFTMCYRPHNYGNNNTTRVSHNDQVLVVKRTKRGRESTARPPAPAPPASEPAMERLLEKMMQDLDADSDDDSSFTLTNATSARSDQSDIDTNDDAADTQMESLETTRSRDQSHDQSHDDLTDHNLTQTEQQTQTTEVSNSTPEKTVTDSVNAETNAESEKDTPKTKSELSEPTFLEAKETFESKSPKNRSPKEEAKKFIQAERCSPKSQAPKNSKIANGRVNAHNKRKGLQPRHDPDFEVGAQVEEAM